MRRELGMFVALVLICLGLWASNADFLGISNVINTGRQIGMLGILAIGISFVIITGGIDLSIGSIVGLTGVLIAKFSSPIPESMGYPLWVGIVLAMAVGVLFIFVVLHLAKRIGYLHGRIAELLLVRL